MTQKHDGGPAYPVDDIVRRNAKGGHYGEPVSSTGMSLRDAAALAALPSVIIACKHNAREGGETFPEMFARKSFECADAFIAARTGGDA